jgi:hypothetical protein
MKRCWLGTLLIILLRAHGWVQNEANVAPTVSCDRCVSDGFGKASNGIRLALALHSQSHELTFTIENVADHDQMLFFGEFRQGRPAPLIVVMLTSKDGKFKEDEFTTPTGGRSSFSPWCMMLRGTSTYSVHRPLPKNYSLRLPLEHFVSLVASESLEDALASGDSMTAYLGVKDSRWCRPCEHASCWTGDAISKKVVVPADWQRRAPHERF